MDRLFFSDNITAITGIAAALCIIAVAFLHWQNTGLRVARYVYSSHRLPSEFKGFRIAQISDYHNTKILENKVVRMTEGEGPDIIVITGDLFDCRKTDVDAGLDLIKRLVKIAPVYMVCGNHEARIDNIENIKDRIISLGVDIIEGRKIRLEKGGKTITLAGVADPRFEGSDFETEEEKLTFRNRLLKFFEGDDSFKILLSHRPEFIHTYRDSGVNLALTGHAHGGQFGIPFTDIGVFVPNQGLFPAYAAGYKTLDDTTMIISRGIGKSVFPFRLFNYPELVMIEFE